MKSLEKIRLPSFSLIFFIFCTPVAASLLDTLSLDPETSYKSYLVALSASSLLYIAYKLAQPLYTNKLHSGFRLRERLMSYLDRNTGRARFQRRSRGLAYDGRAETIAASSAAMATGGAIGGLHNSSNQCFMNSVLQSMASSVELNKFLDSYIEADDKYATLFSFKLKNLLGALNGNYEQRSRTFTTDGLLEVMKDAPRTNYMGHQDQEDAQEFYQNVMKNVEKEFKKTGKSEKKSDEKYVAASPDHLTSIENLSALGCVAIPARQVDPNLPTDDSRVFELELVTPVDGVSAERIGCLSCGEMGGVRYRVISGVSLNLPQPKASNTYYGRVAIGEKYDLEPLLKEWTKPEIMEGVTCNRCAMNQCKDGALAFLESGNRPEVLQAKFRERVAQIDAELAKSVVDDEVYEKFKNSSTVDKVKKSKQIFFSRPPPVLNIHINRSYYDPRTYSLRKNDATVTVPLRLSLDPFVAVPEDINMDARLPFRKQDVGRVPSPEEQAAQSIEPEVVEEPESAEESEEESEIEVESEVEFDTEAEVKSDIEAEASEAETPAEQPPIDSDSESPAVESEDTESVKAVSQVPDGPLTYHLKSIVIHSGLHNYGHYVCYRHYRGTWWYISDDDVFVVTEDHLRNIKGVFMVFYEITPNPEPEIVAVPTEESESDGEKEGLSDEAAASNAEDVVVATATANL
ncbi:hypothetical protein BABINDRAFT_159754 [Babjeviella inositovora NRRL Y-12698]|uniref:ubiquitinyl hydrolase 1 n=1 Tax=Babjeviella inositovora NRRL Y-12698 TaxID=984486 RepID=A0A1E3QUY0_9ASCO|nr:uncharacterized protein BABINDRAFT_159754 [Babjeviella inositovora NRRL Y-12698]ODQ81470.1 hypothetical protein BABINDRAFT_159754 [Babjeviella inositovora NRRL Y-12698]